MRKLVYDPNGYYDAKFDLKTEKGKTDFKSFVLLQGKDWWENTLKLNAILNGHNNAGVLTLPACEINPEHYKQTT